MVKQDTTRKLIQMAIAAKRHEDHCFQQQALARRLGISESLMSRYLRGTQAMPGDIADELLSILGIEKVAEQVAG